MWAENADDFRSERLQFQVATIIGQCLQKKAVTALAEDRSPEAVRLLAKAVTRLKEPEIKANILDTLGKLRNQNCIDAVCEVWADTRHRDLANLLVKKSWVASTPVTLKVITALKVSQPQMITNGGREIVEPLLNAFLDKDPEIANRASECAISLTNSRAIDLICQRWARSRDKFLEQIVCKGKYVAQQPVELKVLTALKVDKLEVIRESGIEIVEPLFDTISDRNSKIANKAKECIYSLTNTDALDYVCNLAIESDSQVAHEVAVRADYAPRDPSRRALFYFLTEQWDKYESLDYEHDLLQKVYELGDEKLRKRIADKARQAGNIAWIQIVAGGRKGQRLEKMTDAEWETTLAILNSSQQWEEMWRLAQKAPAIKSKQLLQQLNKITWFPKAEQERASFERLKHLAERCSEKIPLMGGLITCKETFTGHINHSTRISFCPGKNLLAIIYDVVFPSQYEKTGSFMKVARIKTGNSVIEMRDRFDPLTIKEGEVSFSPDGNFIAGYNNSSATVRLWTMGNNRSLALDGHRRQITGISFSPDEKILATCSEDGTIKLRKMPDGKLLKTLTDHIRRYIDDDGYESEIEYHVNGISFSPDGKLLASCSEDNTIKLWQMPDGKLFKTITDSGTYGLSGLKFSPDGQILAGYRYKEIALWQMPDCKPLTNPIESADYIGGISFSPDGQILYSYNKYGTKAKIDLWQIPDGKHLATTNLRGHSGSLNGVSFSHSDNSLLLASCSDDESIRIWSSDLPQLVYQTVAKLDEHDRKFIEESLQNKKVTEEEKHWLKFMQALMNWHKRFDVEVENAPQLVGTGEFDIEIEG